MTELSNSMQLILALVKTQGQVLKPIENALSLHGLSFSEWLVMHKLNVASDRSLKRASLANSIGLTASGVTRLLKPMEKIGLVEKVTNQRDARMSLVRLSESGIRVYQEATDSIEQGAKKVTQMMSVKQIEQCAGLLTTLHFSAIEASH
ncbi:MarR family winged helix-turn-helix transcriptional regulator [Pseudoalteromonas pernae]|uniref:MarR family winged helix-turn-helix transcriptional regulator n=1 Tax=Pseudoalteromonas pernae TaxID=3118054 RepID=UPI003242AFAB